MKTRLGFLIFLLFFFVVNTQPSIAAIELANGKIEIGGHARFRYEFKNDTDFGVAPAGDANDTRDFVLTRIRPYFKFTPHEQVTIFFEPQFSGGWGEREGTVTALTPFNEAV